MVSDDSKGNRIPVFSSNTTAQKTKFSIKDFFSKCDKIRWKLRIWSHLLKKSLMENFIFCAVIQEYVDHIKNLASVYLRQCRSSRPEVFCKKGVLRNFVKFTGKHLCQSLFFNKLAGLRPTNLLKRDSGKSLCLCCNSISICLLNNVFLNNVEL